MKLKRILYTKQVQQERSENTLYLKIPKTKDGKYTQEEIVLRVSLII